MDLALAALAARLNARIDEEMIVLQMLRTRVELLHQRIRDLENNQQDRGVHRADPEPMPKAKAKAKAAPRVKAKARPKATPKAKNAAMKKPSTKMYKVRD